MSTHETVLITGAAGYIGRLLWTNLPRDGRSFRLLDVKRIQDSLADDEVIVGSIIDMELMEAACEGVDALVHLAGESGETDWARILNANIQGAYTVFEAARRMGVKRLVYASSNHAVGFYPCESAPVPDYAFPRPDSYYGVSKAAAEALGSLYHDRYGIEVVCLRLLSCTPEPANLRALSTWLSPGDTVRIFQAGLTATDPGFCVAWGVSANTRGWFSLEEAEGLGYSPVDNAEEFADDLIARYGEPDLASTELRYVGGNFCTHGYDAMTP